LGEIVRSCGSFRFGRSLGQKLKAAWEPIRVAEEEQQEKQQQHETQGEEVTAAPAPGAEAAGVAPGGDILKPNPLAQVVEGADVLPPGAGFSFSTKYVGATGETLDIAPLLPPAATDDSTNAEPRPTEARSSLLVGSSDDSDLEDFSDDDDDDQQKDT
jgi:hypothetical protein